MSDWSIHVGQHQLQLKADIDALKTEQQQEKQQMEQRLNQRFSIVTETSAAAVMQVQGELCQLKKGIGNDIQAIVRSAAEKLVRMDVMAGGGGRCHWFLKGQGQR